MKNLTALQQERIRQYKEVNKRFKGKTKWYEIDLAEFIEFVSKEAPEKSMRMIANRNYLHSDECARMIAKEEAKMERAGMYNIKNLTPLNALD
jgi:hypothetical protein